MNYVFRCICDNGYTADASGRKCLDIDECKDADVCRNGQCRNTAGSFQCVCPSGAVFNETTQECEDEDECAKSAGEESLLGFLKINFCFT